jgi:hypothetical protein
VQPVIGIKVSQTVPGGKCDSLLLLLLLLLLLGPASGSGYVAQHYALSAVE